MKTEHRWKYRRIFVPGRCKASARNTEQAGRDMTSLMDIVFIMLIFFVVTATFTRETGIETNIARPDLPEPTHIPEDQPLVFEIETANGLFAGGRLIDPEMVGPLIKREMAASSDLQVVVRPARGSHTGMLVRVVDAAYQAGLPETALTVVRKSY